MKDPEAAANTLFADWQRVPGCGEIALPTEEGAVNETQGLDGTVSGANFAAIGTITAEIIAKSAHPTHFLLAEARRDQRQLSFQIVLYANRMVKLAAAGSVPADGNEITIAAGHRAKIGQVVKEGLIVALGDAVDEDYIPYSTAPAAANDHNFRGVVTAQSDGSSITVAPGIKTAIAAGDEEAIEVRTPGFRLTDITGRVTQFGDGTFSVGGVVNCTLTIAPDSDLPPQAVFAGLRPADG